MSKKIEKFLEFNGARISILMAEGTWWVAIKPICEALDVNYNRQFQNLQEDEILSQLFAKQQTVGADKRLREMICLPEKYVYGWLFSIRSDSADLKEYKLKCYDILYNHFHGAITGRMDALTEKIETGMAIADLKEQLLNSAEYARILELQKKQNALDRRLKNLDDDLMKGQLSFVLKDSVE